MELKVWVDGIQRIVCGVTESTTCQNVVYALAHATGKSGRFTLVERWRNNEKKLSPNDNPLQVLLKWGEYSSDVQFILRRIDGTEKSVENEITPFEDNYIPQCSPQSLKEPFVLLTKFDDCLNQKGYDCSEVNIPHSFTKSATKQQSINDDLLNNPKLQVGISGGPPPYRNPPPPNLSANNDLVGRYYLQDINQTRENINLKCNKLNISKRKLHSTINNAHYRELISLVNFQKEKIASQQVELQKYNSEILYWENEEREKESLLDRLSEEIFAVINITKANSVQLRALYYIDEESEIVKQQAKTLSSEITLLRSKVANCETELLQHKNKLRLVVEELLAEEKQTIRKNENKLQLEKNFLVEIDKLQKDLEKTKYSTEEYHKTAEALKKQVAALEIVIIERKKQLECLMQKMKEENLRSLSIRPSEELKCLFEGPNRSGSTRKMIGSPRQLENAVPTNKNPHGVWV